MALPAVARGGGYEVVPGCRADQGEGFDLTAGFASAASSVYHADGHPLHCLTALPGGPLDLPPNPLLNAT